MATSSRLSITDSRRRRHQFVTLSLITSSSRKFVECLYCNITPRSHFTCFGSFHRVRPSYATIQSYSHLQFIQSYKSHSFIHSYNIRSYINTFTHTQHINNINPYMVASVTRILFRLYLFGSVLTYHRVMPQVPTNEQLVIIIFIKSVIPSVSGQEMSLINHVKWQVRTTGHLASTFLLLSYVKWQVQTMDNLSLSFTLFQVVSPKQRTAWVLHLISYQVVDPKQWTTWVFSLSCFRAVSPRQWTTRIYLLPFFKWSVLNIGQLEFTLFCFRAVSPKQWTAWVYFFYFFFIFFVIFKQSVLK